MHLKTATELVMELNKKGLRVHKFLALELYARNLGYNLHERYMFVKGKTLKEIRKILKENN